MKARSAGILIIICLGIPLIATVGFIQYQKTQLRKEIKQQIAFGIQQDKLVLLTFPKAKAQRHITWKNTAEFEFAQQLYDIIKTEIKNDSIYYWCLQDEEETKLNKQLDELVAHILGDKNPTKDRQEQWEDFLTSLFCLQHSPQQLFSIKLIQSTALCQIHYKAVFPSPPVPPPKIG